MKRMKVFEMGSVAVLLACFLRTCCCEEKTDKDLETEFFSTNFEDKVVSVVRTRRLYSYDPVRWENPIPYDEGIFEKQNYVVSAHQRLVSGAGAGFAARPPPHGGLNGRAWRLRRHRPAPP